MVSVILLLVNSYCVPASAIYSSHQPFRHCSHQLPDENNEAENQLLRVTWFPCRVEMGAMVCLHPYLGTLVFSVPADFPAMGEQSDVSMKCFPSFCAGPHTFLKVQQGGPLKASSFPVSFYHRSFLRGKKNLTS